MNAERRQIHNHFKIIIKTLPKEPLFHFLVAGVLLFAAYSWLNGDSDNNDKSDSVIRITEAHVDWLNQIWAKQWQHPATDEELKRLIDSYINEEVMAREAIKLGLDRNDTVIRRRLVQKLEFLIKDTALLDEPAEEDLLQFYTKNKELFRTEARISFSHIFFNTDQRSDAEADAREAIVKLSNTEASSENLGDRSLMESEYINIDRKTLESRFGADFANTVMTLEPGSWAGPVESGYGIHLVHVTDIQPSMHKEYYDVKPQVIQLFREERQRELNARYIEELLKKYDVVVDESVKSFIEAPYTVRETGN